MGGSGGLGFLGDGGDPPPLHYAMTEITPDIVPRNVYGMHPWVPPLPQPMCLRRHVGGYSSMQWYVVIYNSIYLDWVDRID